jgi:hypothetical protein
MGKPFTFPVYLNNIEELKLGRSLRNVNSVVKPLLLPGTFKTMEELTLEESPISENNRKFHYYSFLWKHERNCIGENLFKCKNVVNHLVFPVAFKNTEVFTLENKTIWIMMFQFPFINMKVFTVERSTVR